jgi:hypothetical protein
MNEKQLGEIRYTVTDTVFEKRDFEKLCQSAYKEMSKRDLTNTELEVLCQYMEYMQVISRKENVIKYWPGMAVVVSESDSSVCQIKNVISKLDAQIVWLDLSISK